MNDAATKKNAEKIRNEFWERFDRALEPKNASKRAYADELEELISDAQTRLDAVREEMAADE